MWSAVRWRSSDEENLYLYKNRSPDLLFHDEFYKQHRNLVNYLLVPGPIISGNFIPEEIETVLCFTGKHEVSYSRAPLRTSCSFRNQRCSFLCPSSANEFCSGELDWPRSWRQKRDFPRDSDFHHFLLFRISSFFDLLILFLMQILSLLCFPHTIKTFCCFIKNETYSISTIILFILL